MNVAKKVVISGYYGFHNVGDEAILFSMINALKAYDPHIEITVLSNDPEYTMKTYGVFAVNRWDIKQVANAIKQSDGLISGGGSLLQDKTGIKSIIYYTGVMFLANFYKKKLFIYAQGIGPIDRKMGQRLTKIALNRAEAITVRDGASRNFLQQIGVKKEIDIVPDPVLGIVADDFHCRWMNEQAFSKRVIAISVRDWESSFPFEQPLIMALRDIIKLGYELVFLPMHGKLDEHASKRIVEQLDETHCYIAPHDLSIEEKIALLKQCDLTIGMRLHALIFSAVVGTPFLALSYDPKIDAFAKQMDQPVVANVNEKWSADDLVASFKKHIDHLDEEKEKVMDLAKRMQHDAKRTAEKALTSL